MSIKKTSERPFLATENTQPPGQTPTRSVLEQRVEQARQDNTNRNIATLLPPEILLYCFSFLDFRALINCLRVSKLFGIIAQDSPLLWSSWWQKSWGLDITTLGTINYKNVFLNFVNEKYTIKTSGPFDEKDLIVA